MSDFNVKTILVLSSVCILNLAAGTMYLFGVYSPQVAIQLGYTATDISRVAITGQSAMVILGPVVGKIIDKIGIWMVVVVSSLSVSLGYLLFYLQYVHEYANVLFSCILFLFIGIGSSSLLLVSMKCGLLVLPHHKGIATGLPNSFFGASGLFFSLVGSAFFTGETSRLLFAIFAITTGIFILTLPMIYIVNNDTHAGQVELPTDSSDLDIHDVHNIEIEKLVLKRASFWNLTLTLSILAGVTQMYIYSLGYIVIAIHGGSKFIYSNPNYDSDLQQDQQFQVLLLSLASCLGRLLNTFLGDLVVHKFNQTRLLILSIPLTLTIGGAIMGSLNNSYEFMWLSSIIFGFGYGSLYSAMVQITSDLWGVPNFSFNWGLINLSPVGSNLMLSSYLAYLYDENSKLIDVDNGKSIYVCDLESKCYSSAFDICVILSLIACVLALITYFRVIKPK